MITSSRRQSTAIRDSPRSRTGAPSQPSPPSLTFLLIATFGDTSFPGARFPQHARSTSHRPVSSRGSSCAFLPSAPLSLHTSQLEAFEQRIYHALPRALSATCATSCACTCSSSPPPSGSPAPRHLVLWRLRTLQAPCASYSSLSQRPYRKLRTTNGYGAPDGVIRAGIGPHAILRPMHHPWERGP